MSINMACLNILHFTATPSLCRQTSHKNQNERFGHWLANIKQKKDVSNSAEVIILSERGLIQGWKVFSLTLSVFDDGIHSSYGYKLHMKVFHLNCVIHRIKIVLPPTTAAVIMPELWQHWHHLLLKKRWAITGAQSAALSAHRGLVKTARFHFFFSSMRTIYSIYKAICRRAVQ